MQDFRTFLALLLCMLMIAPSGMAQQAPATIPATAQANTQSAAQSAGMVNSSAANEMNLVHPTVPKASGTGFFNAFTRPYRQPEIDAIRLTNSPRLDSLIRAGKLYLSLEDTIALALENNLDIELSRYGPQIAQADVLRAEAGGLLRGVPTAVRQVQNSALSQSTGGTTGGVGSGSGTQGGTDSSGVGGTVITQTGVAVPNLDPVLFFGASMGHLSRPQSNTVTTGTTALVIDNTNWQAGYQQSWVSGSTLSLGFNNTWFENNNPRSDINPSHGPNLQVQFTQRLLQGWGLAVNNRNIRVAKNDIRVSDLTFKQQVMTTVAGVVNLYWDLVSLNEEFRVNQKAVEVAQKFYEDNKKQVEIGTLAPIEIVRAEARVAEAQQALVNSETAMLQQETILKSALSRTGVASPEIANARVVPTDTLRLPMNETLDPVPDLITRALRMRPDVAQTKVQLDNTKIALAGSRSQLLPSLDFQGSMQNNAPLRQSEHGTHPTGNGPVPPKPGSVLFWVDTEMLWPQLFRRNFPDYSVGFQLNVPIRNRVAQADYIRDRLTLRQQELNLQRQENDIRVSVQNAVTALTQARARYESAQKGRILQEQTLDAENKKYALGASTAFQVVQTQRDLAQAQFNEVSALAAYSRARTQLDLSTADVLSKYNVELAEAQEGRVARGPKPIPPQ